MQKIELYKKMYKNTKIELCKKNVIKKIEKKNIWI